MGNGTTHRFGRNAHRRSETVVEQLGTQLAAPSRVVSDEQASQISQAVRAVGMVLSKRSGRNEYGGVYGELYRREGVNSYKACPPNSLRPSWNGFPPGIRS